MDGASVERPAMDADRRRRDGQVLHRDDGEMLDRSGRVFDAERPRVTVRIRAAGDEVAAGLQQEFGEAAAFDGGGRPAQGEALADTAEVHRTRDRRAVAARPREDPAGTARRVGGRVRACTSPSGAPR